MSDPDQAARIARYELAREIFLVADALLADKPDARELFQNDVASGKGYSGFSPNPKWPAEHYALLAKFAGAKRLVKFSLPPAVNMRTRFAPTKKSRRWRMQAIGIRRVKETYDKLEAEHGPDALFELSISRIDRYGLAHAIKDFEKWAGKTRYFDKKNPGGRPPSTLLHLAYFRFMKKFELTKPAKWFREEIRKLGLAAGLAPITKYGREMYAPCMGEKGISAPSWSEGVAHIRKIVMPAAKLIAAHYYPGKL